MSEDNKFPGPPPPDDFSKTTPNINVGGAADEPNYDWDKTNYNIKVPKQPASDDWGKTVTNIRPIDTTSQDFGRTVIPGSQSAPQSPDWGMTAANINSADLGSSPEDFGGSPGYAKTTPYFQLPEAERAKYQNLPPTPTQKAEQEKLEQAEKGGVPGWVWASLGLFGMFIFALAVLGVVYFLIIRDTSFQVTVRQAPPGSTITVDDKQWGVTSEDGTRKLTNLEPGRRMIKILHPNWDCKPQEVEGRAGEEPEPITARCTQIPAKPNEDCGNFEIGEFDKAERCYYLRLQNLPDPYTAAQLIEALNILIINFDSGKHDIPPARLAALQKAAEYIKRLEDRETTLVLEVGGHTDSDGTPATNTPLSQRRAEAVKAQLVKYGVKEPGLQTRGYGAEKPIRPNDNEKNKFLNRRIQYSVVGNK